VDQLSVLLDPELMLAGLAANELIEGGFPELVDTVTVTVAVVDPARSLAVSVYVVVADGLTVVEPLPLPEVNEPGVMAMLVALLVDQLSVVLEPELTLDGLAVNEEMVGGLDDRCLPSLEAANAAG
jgi:hypothetical protein